MSLKHYRNQSKQLLKSLKAGDAEAAERVAKNLPRVSGCSVEEVLSAEVGLQEVQHVVAREAGYAQWSELTDGNGARFEDLVRLTDAEICDLLKEVEWRDLATALKQLDVGAVSQSHQAVLGLLDHTSDRVRNFLLEEVRFTDATQREVAEAQERILAAAERLGEEGRLPWPPGTERRVKAPAPKPPPTVPAQLQWRSRRLESLKPDQVREMVYGLATMVEASGITSLEALAEGCKSEILAEGIRLAVDGTEPALLREIIEVRADTYLRYLDTRRRVVIEGVASICRGDNPRITQHKAKSCYVVEAEGDFREPEGTVELALRRLQETPASEMTLHELTEFLRDLSWIAHRANAVAPEGLGVLLALADAVDDPLLESGLRLLAELERTPTPLTEEYRERTDSLVGRMEKQKERELVAAHLSHRLATSGLSAVQEGKLGSALDRVLDAAAGD